MLTSSKAHKALLGFGQCGLCRRAFINPVKDQYDVDVVGQCLGGNGACSGLGGLFFWPARRLSWSLPIELEPELAGRSLRVHRQWGWVCQSLALVLMLWAGWRWQLTPAAAAACVLIAGTALLAWIDAETGYLPDRLTLPLLWLGLLVNLDHTFSSLPLAVIGAALGYGLLWLLNHVFLLLTGRAGMGYGDFKLLAALGAWLGAAALPGILLAASYWVCWRLWSCALAGVCKPGRRFILARIWFWEAGSCCFPCLAFCKICLRFSTIIKKITAAFPLLS